MGPLFCLTLFWGWGGSVVLSNSSIFLLYRCDHSVPLQGRKEHIRTDVQEKVQSSPVILLCEMICFLQCSVKSKSLTTKQQTHPSPRIMFDKTTDPLSLRRMLGKTTDPPFPQNNLRQNNGPTLPQNNVRWNNGPERNSSKNCPKNCPLSSPFLCPMPIVREYGIFCYLLPLQWRR